MRIHYFNQTDADTDDSLLQMAKDQGYVPKSCLLGGEVVMRLITSGIDPCKGCKGPRHICKGRPE